MEVGSDPSLPRVSVSYNASTGWYISFHSFAIWLTALLRTTKPDGSIYGECTGGANSRGRGGRGGGQSPVWPPPGSARGGVAM
jgi:hypothetical protein